MGGVTSGQGLVVDGRMPVGVSKQDEQTIREAARNILLEDWDPIGVKDEPLACDEYLSYLPAICHLLTSGVDLSKLTAHLMSLEKISMGLPGNEDRAKRVAKKLLEIDS